MSDSNVPHVPADGTSRVMHLASDDIAILPVGPRRQQGRRVHVRKATEMGHNVWLIEGVDDHGYPFRENLAGDTKTTFVGRWHPGCFA